MQMQTSFVMMFLAALAMGGGSQTLTTSHRRINWGYGCGGNCAVNTSGESETSWATNGPAVRLEDRGTLTQRTSDPGGIMITTTRWKYKFHGTGAKGADHREFELQTDKSGCKKTQEIMDAGKATKKKKTACAKPPRNWKLVCERKDVPVKGEPRPAWVCSPPEHLDNFGTEFPWVFGVEGSITTVVSGEPHATTTYEPSPPPGQHD
jgi:hypothetical protein